MRTFFFWSTISIRVFLLCSPPSTTILNTPIRVFRPSNFPTPNLTPYIAHACNIRGNQTPKQCSGECASLDEFQRRHGVKRSIMPAVLEFIQRSIKDLEEDVVVVGTVVAGAVAAVYEGQHRLDDRSRRLFYTNIVRNHLRFFGLRFDQESKRIVRCLEELTAAAEPTSPPPPPPLLQLSPPRPSRPPRRRRCADLQLIEESVEHPPKRRRF